MTDLSPRWPDYPFESHFWNRDGLKLHYVDVGAGPPVVCVHGNPTWSYYFRRVVGALQANHRCLALDHMGCGLSDKPPCSQYPYRLENRVDDFSRWIDHANIQGPVSLVLHDWGGMIGLAWAVRNPDRVNKLVLLNTAGFPLPPGKAVPWQLKLARTPGLGALLVKGFNAFCRGAVKDCVTKQPLPPDVAAAFVAPYDSWEHRVAVLRFVEDIPLSPREPSWPIVQETSDGLSNLSHRPTFIGWGHRDFVFDLHFLAEWKRRLPNAEYHEYPDCGHYILEDAADDLIPQIARFLS